MLKFIGTMVGVLFVACVCVLVVGATVKFAEWVF